MTNKKYKNWLKYLVVAVVAYLVIKPLANDEVTFPQISTEDQAPKVSDKPQEIDEKPSEKVAVVIHDLPTVAYEVKAHYPEQHFFDDKLCDLDDVRTDYETELKKAINRLKEHYQHYAYNITDNLKLNVYSTDMTPYFETELTERIKTLHKSYINMLGASANRPIRLNLVVMRDRSDYLEYGSYYYKNINNTLGVYFGGLNLAFVDYQHSDDKALKTAIHESVHILNAHIIGKTPHMFSEGMAELYEHMRIKDGKAEITISVEQLTKPSYPLMQFFDDGQWNFLDTGQLYYSSWAWTTFMFTQPIRHKALVYFMKKEQENPCTAFSVGESYSVFQEVYNMFEIDFNEWQESLNANTSVD